MRHPGPSPAMRRPAVAVVTALSVAAVASTAAPAATSSPAAPSAPGAAVPDPPLPALAQVDYLIVTDEALAPAFGPLAAEKAARGLAVEVRTIGAILQVTPPGRDDPETIRAYLRARHLRDGLRYVLLGGDTEVVPARMMVRGAPPEFDVPVACDAYFAGLDGTWDADGDGVFGEWSGDASDLVPELAIGRAPVRTVAEAGTFVAKTLAFRAAAGTPFRDRSVFLAETIGTVDQAVHAEDLIDVLAGSPAPLSVVRRYENSAGWPGSLPLTRLTALGELESGGHALVAQLGVAVCDSMSAGDAFLTAADFAALDNDEPFVLWSYGTTSPLAGDCAVEELLRNPTGGAVAALGSSGIQFVGPLLRAMSGTLGEVYAGGAREIGEAARRAIAAASSSDGPYLTTWTLLGDPELDIGPNAVAAAPRPGVVAASRTLRVEAVGPHRARTAVEISFDLPAADRVRLTVHDIRGRRVAARELGDLPAGAHHARWDGRDTTGAPVAAGVYFVRLSAGHRAGTAKVLLLD